MDLDAIGELVDLVDAWLESGEQLLPGVVWGMLSDVDTLAPESRIDDLPVLIAISMLRVNFENYSDLLAHPDRPRCGSEPTSDYSDGLPGPRLRATARLLRLRLEERRRCPWGDLHL